MIELARHIEALLLENDCVIIPGLGGFVAHYRPAERVADEALFLPPMRTIGFNPQLTMNDGLLIQSVMSASDAGYTDAMRLVDNAVQQLIATLHETGKAELPNIGELHYSLHGSYSFVPFDNKLTTPYLYGLGSIEINELAALHPATPTATTVPHPAITSRKSERPRMKLHIHPSPIAAAAAVIVLVLTSFFFSTPIENTEVIQGNYACLMPEDMFAQIKQRSLVVTPVALKDNKVTHPVAVKEVKVASETATATPKPTVKPTPQAEPEVVATPKATPVPVSSRKYHIIVASVGSESDAHAMAARLVGQGNPLATALIGDGKRRVSINSFATLTEAREVLKQVRQQPGYEAAWILRK